MESINEAQQKEKEKKKQELLNEAQKQAAAIDARKKQDFHKKIYKNEAKKGNTSPRAGSENKSDGTL